jgi:integrase
MEAGRWVEETTKVPTMAEALTTYSASVVAKLKGAATYAYWLEELGRHALAAKPVNSVTAFDLAQWRDEQAARLEAGTVVRKLGLLSGFLTWCQKERGWIADNPMRSVRKPRVNDARDRVLSDEEQGYVLAAARTSRAKWLADVLVVLLRSAMRRGELWGLKCGDVDFVRAVAHLSDTKNGSARDVPLCPQASAALRRLVEAAQMAGRAELVPVADAHAVSLAFRRTLERARVQYGKDCARENCTPSPGFLADLRLHDLRHCAVTTWASTGALSLVELMAVSGHKSPRMLARYSHLNAAQVAGKLAQVASQANKEQPQR